MSIKWSHVIFYDVKMEFLYETNSIYDLFNIWMCKYQKENFIKYKHYHFIQILSNQKYKMLIAEDLQAFNKDLM